MKITYRKPDIRIKRLSMDTTILAGSGDPNKEDKEGEGNFSKRSVFGNDFDTDHDTDTIPRLKSLWDD